MKKILLVVVVLFTALAAQAQEMYLGGGISLWRNTDIDKTSFSITPDFGYNLNSKWAIGGELALAFNGYDGIYEAKTTSFALAPYARYSFYENKIVRLFLQ